MKVIPYSRTVYNEDGDYLQAISHKSKLIYALFLFGVVFIGAFILTRSIAISVGSPAIIKPSSDVSILKSFTSGKVKESFVHENIYVKRNQTLYILDSEILNEQERTLTAKGDDIRRFTEDLNALLNNEDSKQITTSFYQQSSFNYRQKVVESTTRLNKVQADYNRNKKLHSEKVIADAEFENFQFELDKAKNDLALIKENQRSQWQNDLRTYERELQDIEGQLAQLQKQRDNLIIKAPVSGTIQNVTGIYAGSTVMAGQDLAQISPDTSLIVEAYLSPNDIGLIRKKMEARFQIDAFNYNQWGMASGIVEEISNDVQLIDNRPMFKVRCSLNKNFLQLKNGYQGFLKKGMTLQARFMVTERTLWQLLYDKADDWLNPNTFARQ